MTITELYTAFLAASARAERSPKTIRFYQSRLKRFLAEFGARDISTIRSLELKEFLERAGKGMSNSTRHHNAVAITSLHSFALSEELIEKRWFLKSLPKPPMGRRERIPKDEEISRLLEHARPEFRAIYAALAQCGARPGELCKATIQDVDWQKHRIVLLEHKTAKKTGKPRTIAIGAELGKMLAAAIGGRTEGPVFLAPGGGAWLVEALSAMHRRLRDAAGLDTRIVLYSTRHRYGTEMVRRKKPLKDIAEMMGHAKTTTTELYTHIDVTELAGDQDDMPPLPPAKVEDRGSRIEDSAAPPKAA
jgi:integrase